MIEMENAQIEPVEELETYGKYEASPLAAGYGVTIGNALRRVLLSSLEGAAVTSVGRNASPKRAPLMRRSTGTWTPFASISPTPPTPK